MLVNKLKIIFSIFQNGKLLKFGSLFIVSIAIPLTVFLVQQRILNPKAAEKEGADIDVTFIERTPRYDFDAEKKWPDKGETVTFTAHIKNRGNLPSGDFIFEWLIDSERVSADVKQSLAPGEETTQSYQWVWQHPLSSDGRIQDFHAVEFRVDPENKIREISEKNNSVVDYTEALAVGFWVEKSVYDLFNNNQYSYCQDKGCAGSNSWDDWAQRQIKEWNNLFVNANPVISERVRLDKIVVVDDCTLPLHGGWPTNTPDIFDKTVDLMWGFPTTAVGVACPGRDNPNDGNFNLYQKHSEFQNKEYPLLHELTHALRGIPDQYPLDVYRGRDFIEVGNESKEFPLDNFSPAREIYVPKAQDLMTSPESSFYYGEYNSYALKSLERTRNKCTNYNPNNCWPSYTSNLPDQNTLQVIDKNGMPLKGARIDIFRMMKNSVGGKNFYNQASYTGITDSNGLIDIGHNPFGGNNFECGSFRNENECLSSNNWLILLLITVDGNQKEFQFFEYTTVNIAYWKGNTTRAIYSIKTNLSGSYTLPSVLRSALIINPTPIPSPSPMIPPTITPTQTPIQNSTTLPASFYGKVTFNGTNNVASGTPVGIYIDNSLVGSVKTQNFQGNSVYTIPIVGDDPATSQREGGREGDAIIFKVANFEASPKGIWHSGTNTELNLNINIP